MARPDVNTWRPRCASSIATVTRAAPSDRAAAASPRAIAPRIAGSPGPSAATSASRDATAPTRPSGAASGRETSALTPACPSRAGGAEADEIETVATRLEPRLRRDALEHALDLELQRRGEREVVDRAATRAHDVMVMVPGEVLRDLVARE